MAGPMERIHDELLTEGWALATGSALGLAPEADVIAALSPSLALDPRGHGKQHARDVIAYERPNRLLRERDSIAHGNADDFSRFRVADEGPETTWRILDLVPPPLRRPAGRMSADYFRYSPGTRSDAHQDKFGDVVVIWVLDRDGDGAESFLTTLGGEDVMRSPLATGDVLIFRDEMFLHGLTAVGGHRDALIFITLRDGEP
jgi:hypothetical protein